MYPNITVGFKEAIFSRLLIMKNNLKIIKFNDKNRFKKIIAFYEFLSKNMVDFKIEIISADFVFFNNLSELNVFGKAYISKNQYPFLCITDLSISLNQFIEVKIEKRVKIKSQIFFIITLAFEDKLKNDNLFLLLLPNDSRMITC